jgi:excisionase family DNA binding protein
MTVGLRRAGDRPERRGMAATRGGANRTRGRPSCVWRRHRMACYIGDTMPTPPVTVPRYFTVAEVARALGVAQRRFRAMVDAGKGPPATRLSKGRLLFRDDALAAWLAERGMRLVA